MDPTNTTTYIYHCFVLVSFTILTHGISRRVYYQPNTIVIKFLCSYQQVDSVIYDFFRCYGKVLKVKDLDIEGAGCGKRVRDIFYVNVSLVNANKRVEHMY